MLTELSKVHAPSLLLQDFNYFFNKAINQYVNKRYNLYDISQQTTDDLRVLKASSILNATPVTIGTVTGNTDLDTWSSGKAKLFGATYEVVLPSDYLHLLNCVCVYKVGATTKCYDKDDYVQFAAKRLTADSWSAILNDYYNRPKPERPYYYIHNININTKVPTNPYQKSENPNGTDTAVKFDQNNSNFPRTITLGTPYTADVSTVEREAGVRYGNASNVRMEIRYGQDDVFTLEKVIVDYLKAPQVIRLTQEQVNLTQDTSQIMEFPDYVCQEIINELTRLVMENTADPRLQTNTIVTQSIANPAQQQTTQP